MEKRYRRLRKDNIMRGLVRETRISPKSLIYPLFIQEGENLKIPISSMEGQYRYSPDRVVEAIEEARQNQVDKFLLFGIPNSKDSIGSQAYCSDGVVQQGLCKIRENFGDQVQLITDVCMCEYTDHGHCGIIQGDKVDNDLTLEYLSKIAVSHAEAGADVVAPSDMMDGRVKVIRAALDQKQMKDISIMSYAVKYASNFYSPFRDAAGSTPSFGDRKSYQMDFHNKKEALKEVFEDIDEGTDMIIVKPAFLYGDIIREVSEKTSIPVAAYSVSGEYAMIKAASKSGYLDEYGAICESTVAAYRSGANIFISYYAKEIAKAIQMGDIG